MGFVAYQYLIGVDMFIDRQDAGKNLAPLLAKYRGQKNLLVIGLPRGGVVLANEVATYLQAPLDVICPRKVGAPHNPELALGAVTETGAGYFNDDLIRHLGVSQKYLELECAKEQERSKQRLALFRKGLAPLNLQGKTVILVDDGLATGATMKAAIMSARAQKAAKIVVAVPVAPPDTAHEIKAMCDEFVCIDTPWLFQAVGQFYHDFGQTEDEEVVAILEKFHEKSSQPILIGLMGDVMIGRLVDAEQKGSIWGNVLSLMQKCDFRLINLEAALTRSEKVVPKVFNFKSDPEHVQWLKEAKIDIVNLANNHILDYSEEGLLETIATLDQAHVQHVGAGVDLQSAKRPVVVEKQGVKIGIVGYTDNEPSWIARSTAPGTNYIRIGDTAQLKRDIAPLRKEVDILIVSLHWGPNMQERPAKQHINFAHDLIDAGVDIIHGHSSHIFQGVEVYKNRLILYDTGDFVDDYYVDPDLRNDRSFLFLVELGKGGPTKLSLIPVLISNFQVNLAKGQDREETLNRMQALSREFDTHFLDTKDGLEVKIATGTL